MNTQQQMEERLWDYIDGTSLPGEQSAIAQLIESNLEWKKKYHELMDMHQLMNNSLELDEPSMRFTRNVMEDIAKFHIAPATQSYINKRIIWGIGAFFILTILGFLIYSFGSINWAAAGKETTLPFHVDTSSIDKFDFGKLFNNSYTTVFMVINAVLGLVVLDMYLNKKKKQLQQKH
jgi:hypothetical protein